MFQKLVKMIVDTMICEYHPKMLVVIHRCEPIELNSTIVMTAHVTNIVGNFTDRL